MNKVEMMRRAVLELGEAPAADLAAFIANRFGVAIEPRFIPVLLASVREKQLLEDFRQKVRETTGGGPPTAWGLVSPVAAPLLEPLRAVLAFPSGALRLGAVRRFALDLFGRHDLSGWSFGYNRRKQSLGVCFHHDQAIELSVHLVERNGAEEILDTLLHEIAHALVGSGHGHDAVWKKKCMELGARPERCGNADMPVGRWRAQCGACHTFFSRHRKPKDLQGWFCRSCGPELGGLVWREV